ncbi:DUF2080 family transposase-associated protein [Methanococcus voltae]|uniref:Uncharacterized protein n=3 Tax=Methanococcus voltae TaxID=2188 RepID=D7DQR9_METV3|nr:DUF2080 family transposase-associated protein [Methanococcus voltae]MBP2202183.1 putative transposon-encoded protein [Methanococcus voltae]MCS3900856.1 putative transposon-encoded protein [Methanococcus voltae]MCS3922570.1 putative transposon-encoded protein [Methanococcus voltae PS]
MANTAKLDTDVYWGIISPHGNSARFSLPKVELGKEAILIILPDNESIKEKIIGSLVSIEGQ